MAIWILTFFYSLAFILAIPFIILRLLWRSLKLPAYRRKIPERFGLFTVTDAADTTINTTTAKVAKIWLHAVSVGETVAALPLIKSLQLTYPDLPIVLTNTTPTGQQRAQQLLGDSVEFRYLPYDLPFSISRFIKLINPKILILMETELWPNLILHCHKKNIPIIIANAILSDRSIVRYKKIKFIMQQLAAKIAAVASQSSLDKQRFLELGFTKQQVKVTGNLKFDGLTVIAAKKSGKKLKEQLNAHATRLTWIAASTHAGEELQILQAFKQVLLAYPSALLILVPRHPNRSAEVKKLLAKYQYKFVTRSSKLPCEGQHAVLLGDTIGELPKFYWAADVAFVGGSLVPVGGHNLLEPAACGLPIVTGSYLNNFKEIKQLLVQGQALTIVDSVESLQQVIIELFAAKDLRLKFGQKALQVVTSQQGATAEVMNLIGGYL